MAEADSRAHGLDHLLVLLFENRSFDDLFGYLYRPDERPEFEGVLGHPLSNPVPPEFRAGGPERVRVHPAVGLDVPDPDPGEEYPYVNTQLFGLIDPPENARASPGEVHPPYNAPAPGRPATMDGFVRDYIASFQRALGRPPRADEYAQILACHTPDQVPVLAGLARGFACFDHWFCEVPSQTYANRSFVHAGTSSGMVLNTHPGRSFPTDNDAETIFERLSARGLDWAVYYDRHQLVALTGLLHARRLERYFRTHFRTHAELFDDIARGRLPNYGFIEPCMVPPHTDMHPPGAARWRRRLHLPRPSPIRAGERLLARLYEAIRDSRSPVGSNWQNTALLVSFDEHGGTFDHVVPPAVAPPDPGAPPGEMGFRFDRSGLRVPTVLVSAWVEPGRLVQAEYRATSILRTLRERWDLGPPLTGRDAVAADLGPLLDRPSPRPPEEWPRVRPAGEPRGWVRLAAIWDRLAPPPALGRELFEAAIAWEDHRAGRRGPGRPTHGVGHWRLRLRVRRHRFTDFGRPRLRAAGGSRRREEPGPGENGPGGIKVARGR